MQVVYCELPEVGSKFKSKAQLLRHGHGLIKPSADQDTLCTLESVKAVGEVYAPVDCEAREKNAKLFVSRIHLSAQ